MTQQYLKIPMLLFHLQTKINHVERYILALIIAYNDNLYASNSTIAGMFGVARRTVIDAVASLEKKELILCKRIVGRGRSITLRGGALVALLKDAGGAEVAPEVVQKHVNSGAEVAPEVVQKHVNSGAEVAPNRKERKPLKKNTSSGRFTPPTAQQVEDYAKSIGYSLDSVYFVESYASKGWMIGKAKMKDWKATVRTWKARGENNGHRKPTPKNQSEPFDYAAQKSRIGVEVDV